jgi:hypothetical protein
LTDLARTIEPKSDQLNSDDLIAGPITIRISKLSANPSAPEQPISIFFDGDGGKPYKPCKSMRRVLVNTWGSNGEKFIGRSMTLYRDPTVRFGGLEVGGIRISHMSDIDKPVTMALTATRANRKPFTVQPLEKSRDAKPASSALAVELVAEAESFAGRGLPTYQEWFTETLSKEQRAQLVDSGEHARLKQIAIDAETFPGDRM